MKNYLEKAKECLILILKQFRLDRGKIASSMSAFNDYVDADVDPLRNDVKDSSTQYTWQQIFVRNNDLRYIAEVAMRILCSPCSEAACERNIKDQRMMHKKILIQKTSFGCTRYFDEHKRLISSTIFDSCSSTKNMTVSINQKVDIIQQLKT